MMPAEAFGENMVQRLQNLEELDLSFKTIA